jgi:hypothetical protein
MNQLSQIPMAIQVGQIFKKYNVTNDAEKELVDAVESNLEAFTQDMVTNVFSVKDKEGLKSIAPQLMDIFNYIMNVKPLSGTLGKAKQLIDEKVATLKTNVGDTIRNKIMGIQEDEINTIIPYVLNRQISIAKDETNAILADDSQLMDADEDAKLMDELMRSGPGMNALSEEEKKQMVQEAKARKQEDISRLESEREKRAQEALHNLEKAQKELSSFKKSGSTWDSNIIMWVIAVIALIAIVYFLFVKKRR